MCYVQISLVEIVLVNVYARGTYVVTGNIRVLEHSFRYGY